jgi:hypothetical protein
MFASQQEIFAVKPKECADLKKGRQTNRSRQSYDSKAGNEKGNDNEKLSIFDKLS